MKNFYYFMSLFMTAFFTWLLCLCYFMPPWMGWSVFAYDAAICVSFYLVGIFGLMRRQDKTISSAITTLKGASEKLSQSIRDNQPPKEK